MKKTIMIFFVVMFPLMSVANTVVCGGKIDTLAYHANNRLMIKLDSMNVPVFFCSPDSEWSVTGTTYITGPESCKTMYSTFLAMKISGQALGGVYFDGDQVPATCDGWGNWSKANVRYYSFK